jgi:hypothetical protein
VPVEDERIRKASPPDTQVDCIPRLVLRPYEVQRTFLLERRTVNPDDAISASHSSAFGGAARNDALHQLAMLEGRYLLAKPSSTGFRRFSYAIQRPS